jgi:hypothetical protein
MKHPLGVNLKAFNIKRGHYKLTFHSLILVVCLNVPIKWTP